MATITLDPSTVTHTLSNRIFGTYIDIFFHQDYSLSGFQSLFRQVGFETVRLHCDYYPLPPAAAADASWVSDRAFVVPAIAGNLEVTTVVPVTPAHCPSTQTDPTIQSDVAPNGTGYSPADAAAWYESIVAQGTNIVGVEVGNEYTFTCNSDTTTSPSARELRGPHITIKRFPPTEQDRDWNYDWYATHYHLYATAIRNKAAQLGRTVKVAISAAQGVANSSDMTAHKKFLDGSLFTAATTSTSIGNAPYLDALCTHPYPLNRGTSLGLQGMMNSVFHPGDPTSDNDATAHALQVCTNKRQYMNSHGYSNATQWLTEIGPSVGSGTKGVTYVQATCDVAIAIACCNGNRPTVFGGNNWGCETINYTTWSRFNATTEGGYFLGDPNVPNHRFFAARDIIGPFLKTYKAQVQQTIVGSGNTPGNTGNPSVQRIQAAAGLSSDGSRLGVLVANCDLSSSESVTISYGVVPQGQITGLLIPQGWAQTTPAPSIAPFTAGTSFSKTLLPGESYLFVIPISGGPPPPPPPAGDPHTGNFSGAIQLNAAGVGPAPPPPDQNLGFWTDPVLLNSLIPNVPGPPVPGGASGTRHERDQEYGGGGHDDTSTTLPPGSATAEARDPNWGGGGAGRSNP